MPNFKNSDNNVCGNMQLLVSTRRRRVLSKFATAAAMTMIPTLAVGQRRPTVRATEGPFYPESWLQAPVDFSQLEDDADLLWVNNNARFARGIVLELSGHILDQSGKPLANREVQIWQCDSHGRYRHSQDTHTDKIDENFQGFGKTVTDKTGIYRFRTIKPAKYPGRTPHIHFKVKDQASADVLTTQMYVAGDPDNLTDRIYLEIPEESRNAVTRPLSPPKRVTMAGLRRKVTRARFNIVV